MLGLDEKHLKAEKKRLQESAQRPANQSRIKTPRQCKIQITSTLRDCTCKDHFLNLISPDQGNHKQDKSSHLQLHEP